MNADLRFLLCMVWLVVVMLVWVWSLWFGEVWVFCGDCCVWIVGVVVC